MTDTPFKPRAEAAPHTNVVNLCLTTEEFALVKEMAKASGVSTRAFVYQAVMYALDNMEPRL